MIIQSNNHLEQLKKEEILLNQIITNQRHIRNQIIITPTEVVTVIQTTTTIVLEEVLLIEPHLHLDQAIVHARQVQDLQVQDLQVQEETNYLITSKNLAYESIP